MSNVRKIAKNSNFIKDPKTGQNRFAKGTQIGRMKKKGFTLTDLNKLVRRYEATKTDGKTVLQHYIEQLFKDNKLLDKYIDKNVPTRTISELTGAGGEPISITLKEIIYTDKDKE